MNNRKYKTNPDELLKTGQAIMASKDEPKFLLRVFAVNMVLDGKKVVEVCKSAGVSKRTVSKWVKIADEQGFDALRTSPKPGRPPRLSEEKLQEIDNAVQGNASDYGFKVWDGPSLSAFIKQRFEITMGVRQCQRLLHTLGYSRIRPQPFPSKDYENTEEREDFKKEEKKSKKMIL